MYTVQVMLIRKKNLDLLSPSLSKEESIHTGTFYATHTLPYHFFHHTFTTFPLLGLFPSQIVHLLPVLDMEQAMHQLYVIGGGTL